MLSDINVNCTKLFDDICVTLFTAITYKSFASVFALVFPSLSRLRGSKTFLLTTHRVQMSSALHSKCESRKMGRGICPVYIVQPFKLVFAVFVFHLGMEQSLGGRLFSTCPVLEGLRCNCVFVFYLWVACRLAKYQLVLAHWCIGVGARVHIWGVTRPRK